jgi:hypothetical protein
MHVAREKHADEDTQDYQQCIHDSLTTALPGRIDLSQKRKYKGPSEHPLKYADIARSIDLMGQPAYVSYIYFGPPAS